MYICLWQLYLLFICHCTILRYSKFESILCTSNVLYLITKTTFHVLEFHDNSQVKQYFSQIPPPHAPIHIYISVRNIDNLFLMSFEMHLGTVFLNCIDFSFARYYCMIYMFRSIDPFFLTWSFCCMPLPPFQLIVLIKTTCQITGA